ncbi:MAG: BNR/Asp-box repeat protein [Bacteroidetes bacterium]|jgi:hypothetical protein|nr:BNR/Asp-box repeat protein [Bacteroidota bacterium]
MKKQLSFICISLFVMPCFSQNEKLKPSGEINLAQRINSRFVLSEETPSATKLSGNNSNQAQLLQPPPTSTASWNTIAESRNVYGVTQAASRPLQYNAQLNAVSFVHRSGVNYNAAPFNNTGALVTTFSSDWGATWDTTCVWSSNQNSGRYANGGIYNPPGNTNIINGFAVVSSPIVDLNLGGIPGSLFASKQLGGSNNNYTASAVPGAMQYQSNTTPSIAALGKIDFSHYCFTSTNDGKVRTLGKLTLTSGGTGMEDVKYRGINIAKGNFNAGIFNWVGDSMIFNGIVHLNTKQTPSTADDSYMVTGAPMMAWNEAGTHGYAFVIGVRAAASNSQSAGFQPIVWSTSNSGNSWNLMPGIDFSATTYSAILSHIASVKNNTTLTIPFFNTGESVGAVVDANNKLHIVSTIVGTSRAHKDSADYVHTYTMSVNSSTATYMWGHVPGSRPYLYDFMLDGSTTTWNYKLIDSLSSESPGANVGEGGYPENPFDNGGIGPKVISDARIQASRTEDGKYIHYSWAESDTNFVSGGLKYNVIPDIKVRCMDIQNQTGSGNYYLFAKKINVSHMFPFASTLISKKSVFHFMSPVTGPATFTTSPMSLTFKMPFTVTHSPDGHPITGYFYQQTSNHHFYTSAHLDFLSPADLGVPTRLNENTEESYVNLFPNPTSSNVTVHLSVKKKGTISVEVCNILGQRIKTTNMEVQEGENNLPIDINDLSSGIYLVNIKAGNAVSTKKLIIE